MDCTSEWSPFSSATVTLSDKCADKMLCTKDLYAHIHSYRSFLDIEIVSLKSPVAIKGSWLAITKLEVHLKNLFTDDSEKASSTGSDLNFHLMFADFKASLKLKKGQCVCTEGQRQICTSDISDTDLQTEANTLIKSSDTAIHKEGQGKEWQQTPEPNSNNQLISGKHQSCHQKPCHTNLSEISIPKPVVICQSSDFLDDELLNYNTFLKGKPNFKEVQKIFNAIFTTETIQKFKMGTSRDEECNVIFKAVDKADKNQGSAMNTDSKCVKGSTEKSVPKPSTRKGASTNMKEKRDTDVAEVSSLRKTGSPVKKRKTKESSINVPNDDEKEFHYLEEISEDVIANEMVLDNSSQSISVHNGHLQSHNEDESFKQTKEQINESHSCDECNFVTSKKPYLRMHKKRIHSLKKFKCLYCPREFAIEKDFRKHLKCHNDAIMCCDVCGKLYKDQRQLKAHKNTHSVDYVKPKFPCKFCNKSFTDKYVLAYHIKRDHLGMKKSYACPTCGKTFTQKGSCSQHQKNVHLGIKPYLCEICKKSFAYLKSLKEHKSMHNEKKLFKCLTCGKCFQQMTGLCAHRKIHRSSKDYVCSSCGRGFSQKHALIRHERIHVGEKPFECTLCSRLFSDDSVLRRHMISIHKKNATNWRADTVKHTQKHLDALGKS